MKAIVVGMGVQGEKRKKYLGKDFIFSVDKFKNADYKSIFNVPLEAYNAAFLCVPESEKIDLIKYCIKNKKHILVEKPLLIKSSKFLIDLEKKAKINKVILYTAYNHRFEPNILKLKNLIEKKTLGKIYKCKIFYGNGTSYLVKKSKWRDKGLGVVTDIGSHLLDLCLFWFGSKVKKLKITEINKFENNLIRD
jgi:scyllo-inositol 2-dehydrogenase (NADP+)